MQSVFTGQAPITLERKITSGGKEIKQNIIHTIIAIITETNRILVRTSDKKNRANDSTGYTLVEPRHISVPFVYRDYTHAADWPAPHLTLICRGSARVYPAASFFVPNCTLLLRTCSLIRREIVGNKTLPPCLLYTSPSPRDGLLSRMPSSA